MNPIPESSISCVATATPAIVRVEGVAERVGDILLTITSGDRLSTVSDPVLLDVQVGLNTNITNCVLSPANEVDAVLTVDIGHTDGTKHAPSSINGRLVAINALLFENVPFRLSTTAGMSVARISNIRSNASQLGTGKPITAMIVPSTKQGANRLDIQTSMLAVGLAQRGMSFEVIAPHGRSLPIDINQSQGFNADLDPSTTFDSAFSFLLRFSERQPFAFRNKFAEVSAQYELGGQYTEGLIDFSSTTYSGTRLGVRFTNVPDNAQLFVTSRDIMQKGTAHKPARAVLVTAASAVGRGGVVQEYGEGIRLIPVQLSGTTSYAIWELVERNPSTISPIAVEFGVVVVVKPGSASLGSCLVTGNMFPLTTVTTASSAESIPRFVDEPSNSIIFRINR